MQTLLILSNIVLLLLLLEAVRRLWLYRSWHQGIYGTFVSPIPAIESGKFHALLAQNELGPTLQCEVNFIGGGAPGGVSDTEGWVLSVLAKQAHCMFEFGTCTGKTTYLWARNSAPDARIITLTLGQDQHADYTAASDDHPAARRAALNESRFERFLYSGTPVEYKITQLFGDSKRFDETPWLQQCDLIFIDGSHAYSYVKSDTEKALRMLKPGGIILWHDYRYPDQETSDVVQYLNELSKTLSLVWLRGTVFVAYRAPALEESKNFRLIPDCDLCQST